MSHTAYIALGSNLGDRLANLKAAIAALPPHVIPKICSPVYTTPPWGYADQPEFLNQVLRAETDLEPEPLIDYLKRIEMQLGRQPTFRFGPRAIDLDLLFFDELVLERTSVQIPHPRLSQRAFVLVPLAELAPDLPHPVYGLTVRQMLGQVDASDIEWYAPGGCDEQDMNEYPS